MATSPSGPRSRGVPQGSILGPLLFLIYVNDLPHVVSKCTVNLYTDDVTIYATGRDASTVTDCLNHDLDSIASWINVNQLMNVEKTQLMTLGGRSSQAKCQAITVELNGTTIPKANSVKYLGVTIDRDLNWKLHTSNIRKKAFAAIACIHRVSYHLPLNTRKMLYRSLVLPYVNYCSTIWHTCTQVVSNDIERIQNYAMRISSISPPPHTPSAPLREKLNWTTLRQRRHNHMLCQVHRCVLQQAPEYLTCKFLHNSYTSTHGSGKLKIPSPRTNKLKMSFQYQGALHYNNLSADIRCMQSLPTCRKSLKYLNLV